MIGYFAVNLAYFRRFGKNDINNRMHARGQAAKRVDRTANAAHSFIESRVYPL